MTLWQTFLGMPLEGQTIIVGLLTGLALVFVLLVFNFSTIYRHQRQQDRKVLWPDGESEHRDFERTVHHD